MAGKGTCSICLDELLEDHHVLLELSCGHASFHNHCVMEWLVPHLPTPSCPDCRKEVSTMRQFGRTLGIEKRLSEALTCKSCNREVGKQDSFMCCFDCGALVHAECEPDWQKGHGSDPDYVKCTDCTRYAKGEGSNFAAEGISAAPANSKNLAVSSSSSEHRNQVPKPTRASSGSSRVAQPRPEPHENMTDLVIASRSLHVEIRMAETSTDWGNRARLERSLQIVAQVLEGIANDIHAPCGAQSSRPSVAKANKYRDIGLLQALSDGAALRYACREGSVQRIVKGEDEGSAARSIRTAVWRIIRSLASRRTPDGDRLNGLCSRMQRVKGSLRRATRAIANLQSKGRSSPDRRSVLVEEEYALICDVEQHTSTGAPAILTQHKPMPVAQPRPVDTLSAEERLLLRNLADRRRSSAQALRRGCGISSSSQPTKKTVRITQVAACYPRRAKAGLARVKTKAAASETRIDGNPIRRPVKNASWRKTDRSRSDALEMALSGARSPSQNSGAEAGLQPRGTRKAVFKASAASTLDSALNPSTVCDASSAVPGLAELARRAARGRQQALSMPAPTPARGHRAPRRKRRRKRRRAQSTSGASRSGSGGKGKSGAPMPKTKKL
eukprot:INCI13130.1.p1 GENE.INCI13130.1~~INCI13130.1.p1  ORF type:complete len:614 (+),score=63.65 INCI13130.1:152-1993(+)